MCVTVIGRDGEPDRVPPPFFLLLFSFLTDGQQYEDLRNTRSRRNPLLEPARSLAFPLGRSSIVTRSCCLLPPPSLMSLTSDRTLIFPLQGGNVVKESFWRGKGLFDEKCRNKKWFWVYVISI